MFHPGVLSTVIWWSVADWLIHFAHCCLSRIFVFTNKNIMIHKRKEIHKKTNKFTNTKTRRYVRRFTKCVISQKKLFLALICEMFPVHMWITACICGFWSISHKSPNTWTSPHIYCTQANHNRSQHALAPPNHIYYYFSSKLLTYICGSHSYFIWKYDIDVIKTSFINKTSYLLVSTISGF